MHTRLSKHKPTTPHPHHTHKHTSPMLLSPTMMRSAACAAKEMTRRWTRQGRAISSVPHLPAPPLLDPLDAVPHRPGHALVRLGPARNLHTPVAIKEMMQPCLIYLHLSSLPGPGWWLSALRLRTVI